MSRTRNSLINLTVAMVGEVVAVPIGFVARMVFIRTLGAEYLGVNGLFTSILTMLSLVELGIGPAIVFSLYKPLAENDTKKVQAIMQLYKKAYTIIGTVIAALGIVMAPFLSYLIKDVPDIKNIEFIFLLFVINSAISYFYAYKQNLIIADQRRYVVTLYRYAFFSIVNILQIAFLYLTKNYVIFLVLRIVCTLLENLLLARSADKLYPFLRQKATERLDGNTIQEIKKNTSAMVSQKIGEIVTNSTDNIVIAAMVGTIWVGLYSNYILITSALNGIMGQFFTAITASVGNLGATESKEKLLAVFQKIQFATFWIFGFSSICLFYLVNPFIAIWVGNEYWLSMDTVLLLVILFYIQGMRRAVLTFREALGLYWYDRYKPLFQGVINLAISVVLAPKLGVSGVIIGTVISVLTTCFWIEPYFLYKKGFVAPLKSYYFKYAVYTAITVVTGLVTGASVGFITGTSLAAFIGKFIVCLFVPNIIYLVMFYRTKEFQYFLILAKNIVFKKVMKKIG